MGINLGRREMVRRSPSKETRSKKKCLRVPKDEDIDLSEIPEIRSEQLASAKLRSGLEDVPDGMKSPSSDTPAEIQKTLIEGYRRMSAQQKLQRVSELTKAVQQLALARIRKQYGELSDREKRLRLAALWLDRDTMIRVFQWDPRREGY
jgi:hypothetical protein